MKKNSIKKNILLTTLLAAFLICEFMINNIFASGSAPGSAEDPLVSKSYVDDKVSQMMNLINLLSTSGNISGNAYSDYSAPSAGENTTEIVNQVMSQLEYLYGLSPGEAPVDSTFVPVFAFAGQFVIGQEGTEIILRSGRATSYCPGENGLINVTKGLEIYSGADIESNNLLIISRSDGRGVKAATDAWFLVRGNYSVMNF